MKYLLALLLLVSGLTMAPAQDRGAVSDDIFSRGVQLQLLNQIMPLLMTKEQWRKVLPSVEEAREAVRKTEKLEADELKKLQTKMDEAYKNALEKGELPKKELLIEFQTKLSDFSKTRRIIADINTTKVQEAFVATANEGQKKTAIGSITPADFGFKADELKDEARLRLFVSEILLNPIAYDLMRKLSI
ncbi:MAG: hypothetical protein ABL949_00540 [Fimbriimonadaceae bacterium]